MFSPSVDVSEELRQYARMREGEMRLRVDEYRKTREEELVQSLGDKIRDFELKEQLVMNPEAREEEDQIIRGLHIVCQRLRRRIELLATDKSDEYLQKHADPLRDELESELQSEVDKFRFGRECRIADECKRFEDLCMQIRAIEAVADTQVRHELHDKIVGPVKQLVDELKGILTVHTEKQQKRIQAVASEIHERASNAFNHDVRDLNQNLTKKFSCFVAERETELLRRRRKLLFTLEKRIKDLCCEVDLTGNHEVMEAEAEYKAELTHLLYRYLALFRNETPIPPEYRKSKESLPEIISALNVSKSEKIKFFTAFVEKFGNDEFFACLADSIKEPSPNDSISFRS